MWFILIYASTIILYGLYVFVDMEKGDTLKVYFNFTDLELALASLKDIDKTDSKRLEVLKWIGNFATKYDLPIKTEIEKVREQVQNLE